MKKLSIILCTAAAAMLTFACTKAEQNIAPEEKGNNFETPVDVINPDGTRTITVKIAQPVTESQWEDGEGFNWYSEAGTSFGIFTDNDGDENLKSSAVGMNGKDITVTATVPVGAEKAVFYYPFSIAYSQGRSTTTPNTYFGFLEMANQVQTEAGSMDFDVEGGNGNMGLVSSAVLDLTSTSSPFEVTMTPIVALVRFIIYSSTGSSASVKSITLTADSATNKLNGQENVAFNFSTGAISTFCSAAGTLSNKVTLTNAFSLSGVTSASKSSGIYMTIQPTVITGYTISIKMEDNSLYEFHTAAGMTLTAGKIKNIPINLDNATNSPFTPGLSVDRILFNEASDATSTDITLTGKNIEWTATPSAGVTLSTSAGSFTTENSTVITASYAANASAEDVYHTVTFSNNKGLSDIVVTIKQAAVGSADPTYTYGFAGWQAGANQQFLRSVSTAETTESNWFIVFTSIRDDSTGNAPSNEDGWSVLKYGFQLSTSELNVLKAMAKFDFEFTDGESKIWFKGFKSNEGAQRSFNKWFKTSDLSSDYVHMVLVQSGTSSPLDYSSASNLWKPVDVGNYCGYGYYYAGHVAAGKGDTYSLMTHSSATYTLNAEFAAVGTWDNQLFMFPQAGHEVALPAGIYHLQVTIESNNDSSGDSCFFKISQYSSENEKGEGAAIRDFGTFSLTANTPRTLEIFGFTVNADVANICLVFGLGGHPDNTEFTISSITLVEL